jgi:protein SCO1/2
VSRGAAWLIATLILLGSTLYAMQRSPIAAAPLPVLYTLGGEFQLDSTEGERLSLADLKGQVVLLNFGYTGCPDVCPTALARMRDVLDLLGEQRASVQPLFVTLDPEVDTVDRIGPYLDFFDPAFIGLTGSTLEVAQAAQGYKVYYERQPLASTAGYTISHSSHIYLIDAAGQVRATFGEGVPVSTMAETVYRLVTETDGSVWEEA